MSADLRTDRHAAHALHAQPAPLVVDHHHTALQPSHPRQLPPDRITLRHALLLAAALAAGALGSWLHPGPWF